MQNKLKILSVVAFAFAFALVGFILVPASAARATGNCLCVDDLSTATDLATYNMLSAPVCEEAANEPSCVSTVCSSVAGTFYATDEECATALSAWVVSRDNLATSFAGATSVGENGTCFCSAAFPQEKQLTGLDSISDSQSACIPDVAGEAACQGVCNDSKYPGHNYKFFTDTADGGLNKCEIAQNEWEKQLESLKTSAGSVRASQSQFIPDCLLADILTPECRDISIFVMLGINIARYLFAIVGALALLFFIYGGFILILSQGNPEKVKKGTGSILSALIGLAVVFAAYVLVNFLGEAVGISSGVKLL